MRYLNKHNLPQSIVDAVTLDTYDLKKSNPNTISITTLIAPPRIRQLTLRYYDQMEADVSDSIWRLLGSAVHEVLGRIEHKDRVIEQRLSQEVDGVRVTGRPDLYNEQDKIITDYKLTSAWSVVFNKDGKADYANQLNCYAWLHSKAGKEVKGLRVIAILRDWNRRETLKNKDYPEIPIVVIDVPLWDWKEMDSYVRSRVQLHLESKDKADDELEVCNPGERWQVETKYAVYKKTNKTASRVLPSELEAQLWLDTQPEAKRKEFRIEERIGEDKRCRDYCGVNRFCSYYKSVISEAKEGK